MPDRSIPIQIGDPPLPGDLCEIPGARGLVVFAHGSGSSRLSGRNRQVAESLQARGLGTLLFDLLTAEEAEDRAKVFDVALLSRRLLAAVDAMQAPGRAIGLFGASTGAAAALIAAAERPLGVQALVSRGGRPDLAGSVLGDLRTPTLLIVGAADAEVLELNQQAYRQLHGTRDLRIVPRATHLFEEAGALEEVARLAGDWFEAHLEASTSGSA